MPSFLSELHLATLPPLANNTENKTDVFLSPNGHIAIKETLLAKAPIGKTPFQTLWQRMAQETKIRGIGPHLGPVPYSIRKILITNLLRASFSAVEVSLRTGHKNIQSLQPYANILGEAAKHQQVVIIDPSSKYCRPPEKTFPERILI